MYIYKFLHLYLIHYKKRLQNLTLKKKLKLEKQKQKIKSNMKKKIKYLSNKDEVVVSRKSLLQLLIHGY